MSNFLRESFLAVFGGSEKREDALGGNEDSESDPLPGLSHVNTISTSHSEEGSITAVSDLAAKFPALFLLYFSANN